MVIGGILTPKFHLGELVFFGDFEVRILDSEVKRCGNDVLPRVYYEVEYTRGVGSWDRNVRESLLKKRTV